MSKTTSALKTSGLNSFSHRRLSLYSSRSSSLHAHVREHQLKDVLFVEVEVEHSNSSPVALEEAEVDIGTKRVASSLSSLDHNWHNRLVEVVVVRSAIEEDEQRIED